MSNYTKQEAAELDMLSAKVKKKRHELTGMLHHAPGDKTAVVSKELDELLHRMGEIVKKKQHECSTPSSSATS